MLKTTEIDFFLKSSKGHSTLSASTVRIENKFIFKIIEEMLQPKIFILGIPLMRMIRKWL